MKSTLIFSALIGVIASANAVTFTQWNFNNTDNSGTTGTLATSIGVGSAALIGGTTGTFASGNSNGGSTDPETSVDDTAWNISTWAAQGAGSGTRGVQFNTSTVGYSSVIVTWDQRHSNTSTRFTQFQYSIDGTTFTSAGLLNDGIFEGNAGDTWFNNRSVDLSSIAGVAGNANFAFRVVSVFAPSTTAYATASPTGSYSTSGTLRFDMVTVGGTVVPEPTTIAVLGLGVAALARRRKIAR
ncbi:MAG: PEP-CTERM sorting domain-containing protein [Armatimonadetes bacterium]|nr:PEP-CTERM sorting domain-containing protein [Armatimonadota bacterium]